MSKVSRESMTHENGNTFLEGEKNEILGLLHDLNIGLFTILCKKKSVLHIHIDNAASYEILFKHRRNNFKLQ